MTGFSRLGHKGFTLVEAMVSIAVLGLLAGIVTVNLTETRQVEELNSAARIVAADIRSAQSRALTVKNIAFCQDESDAWISCELGDSTCKTMSACTPAPPDGVGIHFSYNSSSYDFYGILNGPGNDFSRTSSEQNFFSRRLELSGGTNVIIDSISSTLPSGTEADVFFQRQNGVMRLNACGGCTEPASLLITLRHIQNNKTRQIMVNALTGRISIE
ncbi:prepilin-type N-terminal cleavage/methylation domain-containing protein [Candidatus Uhrbacteria bacterium]|nr:prepilin-type N-terminal cleavage/methylation domain-containing protein [Candidatus Uhrbacteria bacterium]